MARLMRPCRITMADQQDNAPGDYCRYPVLCALHDGVLLGAGQERQYVALQLQAV